MFFSRFLWQKKGTNFFLFLFVSYYGNKGGLTGYVSISYYVEIENIGVMELQAASRYTRVAPLKAAHALISYC